MIYLCPNCGHQLTSGLVDGIAYCGTCGHSLDSSQINKLMSAAWMVYRQNPETIDRIAKAVGLSEAEATVVEAFMMTSCYSIDEFRAALAELKIGR